MTDVGIYNIFTRSQFIFFSDKTSSSEYLESYYLYENPIDIKSLIPVNSAVPNGKKTFFEEDSDRNQKAY